MSTVTLSPSRSDQALASSAQSRLNIPLNIENWKSLEPETQQELMWFHQHCLDEKISLKEAGEALDYDVSTVFRVLKGTYEGQWKNIVASIKSYRRIVLERGAIQRNEFAENPISRLIWTGLDYALANNVITLVVGESRMGKTVSAEAWRDKNNHGRTVLVTAPPYGGTRFMLTQLADAVGVNKNLSITATIGAVYRAFNRHRILIVDEAHRLLPNDRRANPVMLEILRDIHDKTKCGLAFLATQRFDSDLRKSEYMFEQLLGRIELPVRLPRKLTAAVVEPILKQYFTRPSSKTVETALQVANETGRLGFLVGALKLASRMSSKAGEKLREEHFFKALALRKQMMGETIFAAK